MARKLILASASPHRRAMLENAGLTIEAAASEIDERAVEAALGDEACDGELLAGVLAEAKAAAVAESHADCLVIGCDQTLTLDGEILHKAADMEQARRNLLRLSGGTHHLNSAVALASNGETLWRHTAIARMTMRELDPAYVGRYLSSAGPAVLGSVGCYQIEAKGINLFERVEGDFFTIVGLPLIPLLAELRRLGEIDG
ncbi:MAG: Maf-like protein [Rhizobiaceae bacterium]